MSLEVTYKWGGKGGTPNDIASVTISPWPRKKRNTHIACSLYFLSPLFPFSLRPLPPISPPLLALSPFHSFPHQPPFLFSLPPLPLSHPPSSPRVLPGPHLFAFLPPPAFFPQNSPLSPPVLPLPQHTTTPSSRLGYHTRPTTPSPQQGHGLSLQFLSSPDFWGWGGKWGNRVAIYWKDYKPLVFSSKEWQNICSCPVVTIFYKHYCYFSS